MYNLMRFNPRKELKDFETEDFVFDTSEQFSLNEKEEKIWSYLVTEKGETAPVVFQLMWYQHQLCISYSTEHVHENIRQKASRMAHRIKATLRQKVKATLVLEQPIIADFDLYERNLSTRDLETQAGVIRLYLEKYTGISKQENIFELYGEDGKILGASLQEKGLATCTISEGMNHELLIKGSMNDKQREGFLLTVQQFGYGISYQEIEEYDKTVMQDLFSSGLLEIDKA